MQFPSFLFTAVKGVASLRYCINNLVHGSVVHFVNIDASLTILHRIALLTQNKDSVLILADYFRGSNKFIAVCRVAYIASLYFQPVKF
jgi:hypothetical protein